MLNDCSLCFKFTLILPILVSSHSFYFILSPITFSFSSCSLVFFLLFLISFNFLIFSRSFYSSTYLFTSSSKFIPNYLPNFLLYFLPSSAHSSFRLPYFSDFRDICCCSERCAVNRCLFHRYVADVNKCFSTMFFILFLTASLLLCLLGFQVIVVSS